MKAPRIIHTRAVFWTGAFTVCARLVLIHPRYRGNAPLIAHEETHARQMREMGWWRFWWRYFTSRQARLDIELEAYRVQLALAPNALETLAGLLARDYRLNLTVAQARQLLQQGTAPGAGR